MLSCPKHVHFTSASRRLKVQLWLLLLLRVTERRRLSPGPAAHRHPDRHLLAGRHALVRRRHRALHQPRALADARERDVGARRTTQVPRRQVRRHRQRRRRRPERRASALISGRESVLLRILESIQTL